MEEKKLTLYDESIQLHRQAKQLDMVRNYVAETLSHEPYANMDRTLCILLDLDYDEIMGRE